MIFASCGFFSNTPVVLELSFLVFINVWKIPTNPWEISGDASEKIRPFKSAMHLGGKESWVETKNTPCLLGGSSHLVSS